MSLRREIESFGSTLLIDQDFGGELGATVWDAVIILISNILFILINKILNTIIIIILINYFIYVCFNIYHIEIYFV